MSDDLGILNPNPLSSGKSAEKMGSTYGKWLGIPQDKLEYQEANPDPIYEEARKAQFDRAMGEGPNLEKQYDQEIDRARGFIKSNPEQGLWSQALLDKANQRFVGMTDKLKRRAQYDQSIDKNTMLGAALSVSQAQRKLDRHVEMRKAEAEANFQAERSRAIASILGTAGAVIGTAYGGPAGGAAGSQAGNVFMGGQQQQPMSSYDSRQLDMLGTSNGRANREIA